MYNYTFYDVTMHKYVHVHPIMAMYLLIQTN